MECDSVQVHVEHECSITVSLTTRYRCRLIWSVILAQCRGKICPTGAEVVTLCAWCVHQAVIHGVAHKVGYGMQIHFLQNAGLVGTNGFDG
jgi:hypothetical protein